MPVLQPTQTPLQAPLQKNQQEPLQGLSLTPTEPLTKVTPPVSEPMMPLSEVVKPLQFDPTKLADIHLPETIGYWPLAPGWWALLALIILIPLFFIVWKKMRSADRKPSHAKKMKQLKSQANNELMGIKEAYEQQGTAQEAVKQLSVFLRRYALSLYHRDDIASLTDEQWLNSLDKLSESKQFSQTFYELLTSVPYQPKQAVVDTQLLSQLFDAAKALIEMPHPEINHV